MKRVNVWKRRCDPMLLVFFFTSSFCRETGTRQKRYFWKTPTGFSIFEKIKKSGLRGRGGDGLGFQQGASWTNHQMQVCLHSTQGSIYWWGIEGRFLPPRKNSKLTPKISNELLIPEPGVSGCTNNISITWLRPDCNMPVYWVKLIFSLWFISNCNV